MAFDGSHNRPLLIPSTRVSFSSLLRSGYSRPPIAVKTEVRRCGEGFLGFVNDLQSFLWLPLTPLSFFLALPPGQGNWRSGLGKGGRTPRASNDSLADYIFFFTKSIEIYRCKHQTEGTQRISIALRYDGFFGETSFCRNFNRSNRCMAKNVTSSKWSIVKCIARNVTLQK